MRARIVIDAIDAVGGALAAPTATGQTTREGLYVRVRDEAGREGLGEASPLPGYSAESLADCRRALEAVGSLVVDPRAAVAEIAALSAEVAPAAARFALETALFDVVGRRLEEPVWRLLRPRGEVARVALGAVVAANPGVVAAARTATARGCTTIKVKLGRDAYADERAALLALRTELGPAVALRADVNRAWTAAEARERLAELAPLDLELVEEPVQAGNLAELEPAPVPIAVDESLARPDAERWLVDQLGARRLQAVVLKPALLGGLTRCLRLAELARRGGARVVVSHMFDGPVALAAACELALALAPRLACGLDPHPALTAYPRRPIPQLLAGAVRSTGAPGLGVA